MPNDEQPKKRRRRKTVNVRAPRTRTRKWRLTPTQQIRIGGVIIRTDSTVTLSFPATNNADVTRESVAVKSLRLDVPLN